MAATGAGSGSSVPPNFFLTPQQQSLLFTALNANKQQQANAKSGLSLSPTSFKPNPLQSLDGAAFQESPFLDHYDYDFGDSSFDFSFANDAGQTVPIGDVQDRAMSAKSDSTETDNPEKRNHPDDEEDDASPGNDSKRHEGSDKVPKKPGRKPLTSEPTSKRKAQNRAAQRAFRERKEKHLKDLETKVEELEKASEAANHENDLLRAQVERISAELNHYKQRMALVTPKTSAPVRAQTFGAAAISNLPDVNFQFEFPKFGNLPGPPAKAAHQKSMSQPISPVSNQASSPATNQNNVEKPARMSQQAARNAQFKEDLAKFNNGVFNMHTPSMSSSTATGSRASVDSVNYSMNNTTSSPSASSHSNVGASSSCGTSPEPFTQSPMGFKPVDTLTTIGEEHPSMSTTEGPFSQFAGLDFSNNSFDWMVQQNNGGQFDPQLFGDYREPQENIMANPTFDDLFNDSLEADFFTPYNMASPNLSKKTNLIDEIDAAKDNVDDDSTLTKSNMSCNQLWERLQACPKAQNGEFDLDGLCSELTKKAKCSGSGPVVAERDFDTILKKYMGKEAADCTADKLGIALEKTPSEPLVMP